MTQRFHPALTAAVIIEHAGKFLMVEEFNEDQDNRLVFGMPAGHIELHEDIIGAARREGFEESGLKLKITALSGIYTYVKDDSTIIRFCFAAEPESPPDKLMSHDPDHEILAVRWYTREEIYAGRDRWRTRLVGLCMDDYLAGRRWPLEMLHTISTVTQP